MKLKVQQYEALDLPIKCDLVVCCIIEWKTEEPTSKEKRWRKISSDV